MKKIIIGIQVINRIHNVSNVQEVLTEFGCNIKTRIGLHDTNDKTCSLNGILILETYGEKEKIKQLIYKLNSIQGILIKTMVFEENQLDK